MANIPQSRLILYILIAGLIPLFFSVANFITKKGEVEKLHNTLLHVEQLAFATEKKQSLNRIVKDHYLNADHFYIDKYLESENFLQPEAKTLQKLVNNKYFAGDDTVKNRLDFLTGPANKLLFSEGNVVTYPYFQETVATLVHPVEVDVEDIKKILATIEGEPIGEVKPGPKRPQLIILDFKIDKKEVTNKNQVFVLNLKLLKREYF